VAALTFGSLFSGCGGMDLGLERAGMKCVWQCEIDDYANRVLMKHWPDVPRWRDVRSLLTGDAMCSAEASPVKTSVSPATAQGSMENAADFGASSFESFASFDQATSSWRTSQRCLAGGLEPFSATWPESGLMHRGRCYRRAPSVPHTCDDDCSLWPTPTASMDGRGFGIPLHDKTGRYKQSTVRRVQELVGKHGWRIHPNFTEVLMGFPLDLTAIVSSETLSSLKSPNTSADAS
jgi:hypothetical protein